MNNKIAYWYSLILMVVCSSLAFVFVYWEYWKAVLPMFLLSFVIYVFVDIFFKPKGILNWNNVVSSIIFVLDIIVYSWFHINEKEFSPTVVFGMIALLLIIFVIWGILELVKYKRKTFVVENDVSVIDSE
ncbi:MAG: hypothetical protein FWF56_06970 [Firmicutes bacterium]|nr:hypothetical protein [Bacillota bacterium]